MFLSNASIRRPVAMSALLIALAILGFNAYRTIRLEFMPKVDFPYITVLTVYPGGSPSDIEVDIAKRVEDAVVSIDGVKHVNSVAMENVCQTLIEFQMGVDVDVAANDVRSKLDLILVDLPEGCEKPKVLKFDINALPVVTLALSGDAPVDELFDFADNLLRDRLATLPGVATVELVGGAKREVHVTLDRDKLAARGLTSMSVVEAVQKGVKTVPSGRVRERGMEYSVKFDAEYEDLAALGGLEVANENGVRTYLRDVAEVGMTTEELRQTADIDGKPAIIVKVVKKADANAVEVVNGVRGALDRLRTGLPGGMRLDWVEDDGTFIQASVDSATSNIIQGVLLTALILFLFLYNVRSTIIVAITMPLTIVIGLFFMKAVGYSLNMPTLMSIGLSVGILVTNSIVVLESILTRLQETGDPVKASRLGAGEVGIAVLASAGTNVVVLFPIIIMKSMVGFFFAPFALSMVIMTVASLFISFTLTPILCAKLLKPVPEGAGGLLALMDRLWNGALDAVTEGFIRLLRFFEKNRLAALAFMAFCVFMLWHSLGLAAGLGFAFFPDSDRGKVSVKLEYPTSYDLERTTARVEEVKQRLAGLPGLKHMVTTIGKVEGVLGQASEGVYLAQVTLVFPQRTERAEKGDELVEAARRNMQGYADAIVTVSTPSTVGGQSAKIEVEIAGEDLALLDGLALRLEKTLRGRSGFDDVDTSVRIGKPELRVTPKREVLSDLGMPAVGVGMALRANLEGLTSAVYKKEGRNYDIVVKLAEKEGKEQVGQFLLPGPPGSPLLLSTVGEVAERLAPIQVLRKDKMRISKVFVNNSPDKPLGEAVDDIKELFATEIPLPAGYVLFFPGEYEVMQEGNAAFAEAGLIAIILVYLTLAAILESFFRPFIILLTLPLGFVGVVWALWAAGLAINMMVMLGIVMLIGIVVNNAILIMDSVEQYRGKGMSSHDAMITACRDQFRPIVMITAAAILGMLPLAMDQGIGSEPRVPLGVASVGGIAISAVLTLLVIPIVYDFFTRRKKHGAGTGPDVTPPAAEPGPEAPEPAPSE